MEDKVLFLRQWLAKTIAEQPELVKLNTNPTAFYLALFEIWSKDIQEAMKSLSKEVLNK